MNILLMILRAARPSKTPGLQAIVKPRWIRRGYDGMTFFGYIITHSRGDADAMNSPSSTMRNHEMIHLYQARSTFDSWLCFYVRYLYYWLSISIAYPLFCRHEGRRIRHAGYWLNPFEMEAYRNMHNLHYLDDKPQGTDNWRNYARQSLTERAMDLLRHRK